MNKSSALAPDAAAALAAFRPQPPDFDLPVEPGFVSKAARVDWDAMFRRCEEMMPHLNARPGDAQRRLAEKVDVEFVL